MRTVFAVYIVFASPQTMAGAYTVGMVAEILGRKKQSSGRKLADLFSTSKAGPASLTALEPIQPEKSKKIGSQSSSHGRGFNPPAGIMHEALAKADTEDGDVDHGGKQSKKKPEKRLRRDRLKKATEKRTIFVGNVPLTADKKKLTKLFKQFGEIESIRFRCAPIKDPGTKKKVAVITKTFHEKRHNISSYICFKEEEAAQKAQALNGHIIDGFHLRVDSSKPQLKNINKRSVFVGNLTFDIEEENIRIHFEDCGEIENVRVIRDRKTNLGKGFCYILFKSQDSVPLALKLQNTELKNRKLRIQRCVSPLKTASKNRNASSVVKQPIKSKKEKNKMWRPTNASSTQVVHKKKEAFDRKLRKTEKKKKQRNKMNEVTRVLGPLQQPSAKMSKMKMKTRAETGRKVGKKGRKA